MNIAKYYSEYLTYLDEQAKDQFHTDSEHISKDQSFSKEFLNSKKGELEGLVFQQLKAELLGAGPIESLVQDMSVTEIIVNSYDKIFYEKNGVIKEYYRGFSCPTSYHNVIERICHEAGIEFNSIRPHADGKWRDFRVHIISAPLIQGQAKLCLRRNSKNYWSLKRLTDVQWCTKQEQEWLTQLVNDKANVLVIGPTNTGKTTCINACLQMTPKNERTVFIEDTDELALPNPLSVKLLTRNQTDSGLKAYTQQDLLHQCLRMRPDRIVVGEVRGQEAKDYLMALATGHKGSWCSLHAETPRQALQRLELLVQMAQPQWSSKSVRQLIHLGLDAIVSLENIQGQRRLDSIHLLASLEETGFCLEKMGDAF